MLSSGAGRVRVILLCGVLALGGCAEAELIAHTAKEIQHATREPAAKTGDYKVGKPYQISGVWYYPKVDYDYGETGIASWYGPGFHGKRTANGESYNQRDLTAAHRTLPLPSMVQVTNLENGRQLKLRVNDRGPFAHGRIIDVSERAAELLGFKKDGTAKVRVEVLEAESRRLAAAALSGDANRNAPDAAPTAEVTTASLEAPAGDREIRTDAAPQRQAASAAAEAEAPPEPDGEVSYAPVQDTAIFVQAGAFLRYDNANELRARLSSLGDVRIARAKVDGKQFFRVRLGPVTTVDQADHLLDRLVRNGYTQARVVVD